MVAVTRLMGRLHLDALKDESHGDRSAVEPLPQPASVPDRT